MKLVRFGSLGRERPGILDEAGRIRDLSNHVEDIAGDTLSPDGLHALSQLKTSDLPVVAEDVRYGPCVAKVGKFICIGLNYSDHALETGAAIPKEPVFFMKATSAISGPNDDIIRPRGSNKLDWEVELALVIGRPAAYVDEAHAEQYIAGYCICNDVSERNFQLERGGQWDKGKGCDTFGPLGPWLVTQDAISEVDNLDMRLEVNGHCYQEGNTHKMVFKPAFLVSYVSQFMSLQAGDVISTGTPPGVGLGQKPPVYLNAGDQVRLSISGLGVQEQRVVDWQAR